MQATGNLHLGNYLGAMTRWVDMQNTHECLYLHRGHARDHDVAGTGRAQGLRSARWPPPM